MPRRRKTKPKRPVVSATTRAADERLRESLRTADLDAFDRALSKTLKPLTSPRTGS